MRLRNPGGRRPPTRSTRQPPANSASSSWRVTTAIYLGRRERNSPQRGEPWKDRDACPTADAPDDVFAGPEAARRAGGEGADRLGPAGVRAGLRVPARRGQRRPGRRLLRPGGDGDLGGGAGHRRGRGGGGEVGPEPRQAHARPRPVGGADSSRRELYARAL